MRLYIKNGSDYEELQAGLISIRASLSGRSSTEPFVDGDKTRVLSSGTVIKLRLMLTDDTVAGRLITIAERGGRADVRLSAGAIVREFCGAVMITEMYSSDFYGTEVIIEIRQ